MTKRLFLLRHAKSSWDDPSLADHARPLAKRGRKAAAAIRRYMKSEKIAPDLVLVSTARRAQETLEALAPWREPPRVENLEALYDASAPRLLELLRGVDGVFHRVLLIGHNPGLKDLATLLVGGETASGAAQRMTEAFPTAALAQFELEGPWTRIGEGGESLARFIVPRELKDAP